MGGAFAVPGNTGPVAEFNYYVDPHAADIVLNSGLSVTVVPLDLTEQVVITRSELKEAAETVKTPLLKFILRFTAPYMRYHHQTLGFQGGYLHDPMAVAIAIDPALARSIPATIRVESDGRLTRGMTQAECQSGSKRSSTHIAVTIDKKRFIGLFHKRVLTA
jgi:inosine-uridine nucleoside N-ribohydrolase